MQTQIEKDVISIKISLFDIFCTKFPESNSINREDQLIFSRS